MATIRDVAKRAGVAPITVSRVLNNSGYVSAATRARVEQAAADLNFVPNMLAHSLRSNRTNTLALVVTDITNPFWTTVARGVEDVASDQNFNVIFCNTDESEEKQAQYLSMLLRRRVDGVLLVPASSAGDAVRALQAQDVKVVVLDRQVAGVEVDTVRGDSVAGARHLAEHLLQLGHRRIAMLAGPESLSVTAQRVAGYQEALQAWHVAVDPSLIRYGAFTVESGYVMANEVLALQPRPTALFAANNFIAAGALRALRAAALEVPEDISVVVFDELPNPYGDEPRLSAAIQPAYDLGQTATRLLLQRITGEAPEAYQDIVLPTELAVRTSSRRLAAEQA
ncbi:MAG: LacI family DNA-binding transcriptional regulator [Caldilineaceae bacterium]|nr:LacI family DNA-binding transcriptional regulator [Caldilineaceae bacterium]